MEFESILYLEQPDEEDLPRLAPGFFQDLNLDQIVREVQKLAGAYAVEKLYYAFPQSAAEENYRRGIFQDMKKPAVNAAFMAFSENMRIYAKASANIHQLENPIQRMAWHVAAANAYCRAVNELLERLTALETEGTLCAQGLLCLCAWLRRMSEDEQFQKLAEGAEEVAALLQALHFVIEIENNKVVIREGTVPGTYRDLLRELAPVDGDCVSPFAPVLLMAPLEAELFRTFENRFPQIFRKIEAFGDKFPSFGEERILALEQEVQYYLAFARFEREMQEKGCCFCVPQTDESQNMQAHGLYDLALACSNLRRGKTVVSNDFHYEKEERFFVVNGPNQGGKTTFARSLGQLLYFTKMGLDVPAKSANVHAFQKLLTHFSVEESMETGQGKLMEELRRLAPMMEEESSHSFVIINELFTTAAHYDGCVMGARVLQHFIASGSRGIYVTHLRELGETVDGVVTMTATVDGSEEHRRTYKILRSHPEEVGYAEDIVKKYGLTYEQLRVRMEQQSKEQAQV